MPETARIAAPTMLSLADPRVKEKLQELRQTDNFTNIYYLVRDYAFLIATIAGTLAFYHYRADLGLAWAWNIPVTMLAVLFIGAGQHQLTALAHEASHHTLFKHRLVNDIVGDWFCMYPLYSTMHHYRLQHLAHHQFVNDPLHDPDVSQLQTSGHWLSFPVAKKTFILTLLRQLWVGGLIRYMRIRAKYNAMPSDKNPYLKKGSTPNKSVVRIGIVYLVAQVLTMAACVYYEQPLLLAIVPNLLWLAAMAFFGTIPASMYFQSRVHPVISMRAMSMGRVTYITAIFTALAWASLYLTPYAALYYLLLWVVPIFTSFSFFMIMRQLVQHGNGDRGWLTNTRVFMVHPFIRFSVFPIGQDYHLPHHLYASVPHYRLRDLHEFLVQCAEYRDQAVEVEGYFFPYERPPVKPTVLDVLGPKFHHRAAEVYIDNEVLEAEEVEDKDDILRTGEEEKNKRRAELAGERV